MVSSNTKRKESKDSADLYSTPKVALDAIKSELLEDFGNIAKGNIGNSFRNDVEVLEPCAGVGAISEYLKDMSREVSDYFNLLVWDNEMHDYGYETNYNCDFLNNDEVNADADIIVSNPPYNKAVEFILKGFECAPIQWHLLRLSFLEGQDRHTQLMSKGFLSDVYVFSYRISCPKGVDLEPSANSVPYAWFRFSKYHVGQPKLHWLTK